MAVVRGHRDSVCEFNETQCQKVVEADRLPMRASQVEHELAHGRPECSAHPEPGRSGPEHIDRDPTPPATAQIVEPQQAKAQHHEGKRRRIVKAGLAGQREAKTVLVEWVLDLHVRSEHGIGGRQNRSDDDPDAPRQAQHRNGRRCH